MKVIATLSLATLALLATSAAGDNPSVDDVKGFAKPYTPLPNEPLAGAAKDNAIAGLAAPFTYDGFKYIGSDPAAMKKCTKTYKATGTIKDAKKLAPFFDCMINANYLAGFESEADWAAADLAKLPAPFKKHKAKLTKLAKDHAIVISHYLEEGEGLYDNWNLYAVKKDTDGKLMLDTLLTGSAKAKPKK